MGRNQDPPAEVKRARGLFKMLSRDVSAVAEATLTAQASVDQPELKLKPAYAVLRTIAATDADFALDASTVPGPHS